MKKKEKKEKEYRVIPLEEALHSVKLAVEQHPELNGIMILTCKIGEDAVGVVEHGSWSDLKKIIALMSIRNRIGLKEGVRVIVDGQDTEEWKADEFLEIEG